VEHCFVHPLLTRIVLFPLLHVYIIELVTFTLLTYGWARPRIRYLLNFRILFHAYSTANEQFI